MLSLVATLGRGGNFCWRVNSLECALAAYSEPQPPTTSLPLSLPIPSSPPSTFYALLPFPWRLQWFPMFLPRIFLPRPRLKWSVRWKRPTSTMPRNWRSAGCLEICSLGIGVIHSNVCCTGTGVCRLASPLWLVPWKKFRGAKSKGSPHHLELGPFLAR